MHFLIAAVLVVQALIYLVGFAKAYGLAPVPQLTSHLPLVGKTDGCLLVFSF